ncbi:MAG: FAD-dependent oxidoreductase [Streptosporangiaceae bacterium]|nr:FAD-dependent oxidoreductase [Streptosporangiaceae bacterium]MBV9856196.1 FAD-dependent oxidoreductase [Streptosporangiaceae bacterium]
MSTERPDAVIVGAGLAGCAVAWALAGRGRSVVVIEAFEPGHRRGSSHGSARIFRRAYPDPLYVRLTGRAGRLWRRLEDEAGEELLHVTGGLDFGKGPGPEDMHGLLAANGVSAELLPPAAAAERWPGFAFGPAEGPVLYTGEAGVIDADRAMAAMRRVATRNGAVFRYETPALGVAAGGVGAVVRTPDRSFAAPVVVVAAGAWLEPLLGGHIPLPPLTVTQQEAFHFAPAGIPAGGPAPPAAPWPTFIYHDDVAVYGLPAGRDGEAPGAVKVGEHGNGTVTTGDGRDGVISRAARERATRFARRRLPGLDPRPVGELTCLYTSTANEDFILDRRGPFIVCSACSGHGAKFAPLTGELVAALACGGPPPDPRFTLAAHLA